MSEKISGFAVHVHHDILVEWCYDYDERLEVIETDKPEHERAIRKKLFKMLPPEAVAELPEQLRIACAEWVQARAEYDRACEECNRTHAERDELIEMFLNGLIDQEYFINAVQLENYVCPYDEYNHAWAEYDRAREEWDRAYDEWPQADREAWHARWCGCSEWNGKEIVFDEKEADR